MITLEQIEALMLNATLYKPLHISHLTVEHEVIKDLCTLAKRRLATMPRPIADAPRDGTEVLLIRRTKYFPFIGVGSFGIARAQDDGYRAGLGQPNWLQYDKIHLAADPTHFIPLSALEGE